MSNGNTPKLNACGCCQAEPSLVTISNRPGLSALSYRIGTYGLFFQRMLDEIQSYTFPGAPNPPPHPLSRLTTRSEDDPAIALLDAWAVIADVLTFYQERIANEGFLRTATERRSIMELARGIGYELSPGVAASAYLQFTVEEVIGTTPAPTVNIPGVKVQPPAGPGSSVFNSGIVDIPQGTQVQSVPAPGGVPQTFETSANFQAQVDWNTLQPRLSRQQDLALDSQGNLYLLGTSSSFPSGAGSMQLQVSDLYLLNPLTQLDFMSASFQPPPFLSGLVLEETNFGSFGLRQLSFSSSSALSISKSFAGTSFSAIQAAQAVSGSKINASLQKAKPSVSSSLQKFAAIKKGPGSNGAIGSIGKKTAGLGGGILEGGFGGSFGGGGGGPAQTGSSGATVPGVPVNFIYLQGASTNIKSGDRLLLVGMQKTATMSKVFIVRNVITDSTANTTLVEFADRLNLPAFAEGTFPSTDLKVQGIAFNQDNVTAYILSKTITEGDLQAFLQMNGWNAEDLATLVNNPPPPAPSEEGVYSFAAKASFFGNNAPSWKSLTKPAFLREDPYPMNWDAANNGAGRSIWTDSQGNPLTDGDVYLDRAYPQVLTSSWVAFESPNISGDAVYQVIGVTEKAVADYTLSGRSTVLTLQLTPSTIGLGLGSPSATAWSANRLDAFVVGFDGNLYHRWWDGSNWGGPENLGGGKLINSPSVASWAANRLDVFAVGSDGNLYHAAWNGSVWGGPENLGGGNLINSPSAVSWAANRLDIFAIGSDGHLHHKWWGGSWGGVEDLGGGNFANSPSAVSWAANRLDIFTIGSDGHLHHTWWDGSNWGNWEDRGGNNYINSPSAVSWAANRLDVFAIGSDGNLYHHWWDNVSWHDGENLGGGNLTNSPSGVAWAANRLDIFALGSDGNLYHKWWDGGSWGGPQNLSGNDNLINTPSAVTWAAGRLDVFIVGASGHWFHKWWDGSTWGGPEDLGNGSVAFFPVRKTTAWVQSQQLALANVPVVDEIPAGTAEIMLNDIVIGLTPGQPVALSGTQSDPPGVAGNEILFLTNISHVGGFTVIDFTTVPGIPTGLKNNYIRSSVVINANVTLATHGATVQEVLGNGDGSQSNQSFTLKRPPLTYTSAPTPSGIVSSLHVRVNGLEWQESPALYELTVSDQEYIVRLADDGTPTLTFGDPASRLKTGQQNVTATYRTGIGLVGNVAAGSLSLLQSRPPGLRGVTNPLAASGAADPQNIADARANAPLTAVTLDRIVSVEDYQSFAQAFAGVGKAQAVALWSGEVQIVQITIAAADSSTVQPSDPLAQTLIQAITLAHDPVQDFMVEGYQPLAFNLNAAVLIDTTYLASTVLAAVNTALTTAFAFSRRAFAQAVTAAEILKLIQAVPGVIAVDLNQLYQTGDPSGPSQTEPLPFLSALPARYDNRAILPAQLLLLNPLGATVTEMTS